MDQHNFGAWTLHIDANCVSERRIGTRAGTTVCVAVLSNEVTFHRIGMAVRVEIVSAVVQRGAALCLGTVWIR